MPHLGMNKAILIGVLDDVPRFYAGARPRLTLKLHTAESYFDESGTERVRRTWHHVVVWGRRAEALAPWLVRGKRVAVEGRIVNSSWHDSQGRTRYRTEIHAHDVVLLDRSHEGVGATPDAGPPAGDRDAA